MTGRPLKIVHAVGPTPAGGLERVVESLAVGHHRKGHDVTVATALLTTDQNHPFVEALGTARVPVHEIRITSRAYLKERRAFLELCRKSRPDVVHTHGYRRDIVYRPVAAGLGIPTVTTIHGRDRTGGLKGSLFEKLQTLNFRRFDAVVAVSKALYEDTLASGVRPERLHFIPNAFARLTEPFSREVARGRLDVPAGAQVVGWVGRLTPVKGADIFLEGLSLIPAPRPFAVVIGYGPDESALRERARQLGLESTVRFHTTIHDAARYFPAFDTYVLSSRSEGLPIVLLEAMAAEVPIVAAGVGGVPEVLGDGEGWLVPAENPTALATAIRASLSDRPAAVARARGATERLQREYGLDEFLNRYEDVYRGVILDRVGQG